MSEKKSNVLHNFSIVLAILACIAGMIAAGLFIADGLSGFVVGFICFSFLCDLYDRIKWS